MFEFDKNQRLHSRKRTETLFKQGKSFLIFPLSVRYIIKQGQGNVSVLVVCPKKYQKKAVSRNRIKRLIRENYRLNSLKLKELAATKQLDIDFSLSYVNKQMTDYITMQKTILAILDKLSENVQNLTVISA
ncbi:MAG: ribonuclease P protein component [Bacteroidales bacterium]|nr:ribonuclease P protein component [Bacteroidales bacterium]